MTKTHMLHNIKYQHLVVILMEMLRHLLDGCSKLLKREGAMALKDKITELLQRHYSDTPAPVHPCTRLQPHDLFASVDYRVLDYRVFDYVEEFWSLFNDNVISAASGAIAQFMVSCAVTGESLGHMLFRIKRAVRSIHKLTAHTVHEGDYALCCNGILSDVVIENYLAKYDGANREVVRHELEVIRVVHNRTRIPLDQLIVRLEGLFERKKDLLTPGPDFETC